MIITWWKHHKAKQRLKQTKRLRNHDFTHLAPQIAAALQKKTVSKYDKVVVRQSLRQRLYMYYHKDVFRIDHKSHIPTVQPVSSNSPQTNDDAND